ncbi:SdrD B-like domain-containing protein, partial [Staphylococcus coagulans]|uniref:SdrD B-like domain-containing protein n=1 Tax=Staphylococcus coagulans TaxID=74706 RepID=UPI003364CD6D
GIQDDGEKGIGDVKVTLTDKDGKVYETKTDESGNYKFEGLTNGDYTVKFETPSGYEPTGKDQGGNDEKDSDGTEVSVKINGKNDLTIDSGFYKPTYNLGDKVWEDTNK